MRAEFIEVLRIIIRWIWLIVIIVGGIVGILFLTSRNADKLYTATVILQVTTPDPDDIAVIDEYISSNDRDEIAIETNKFLLIAQYPEIINRTQQILNLTEEYTVEADSRLGSDFIDLAITATSPELAQTIANTHAEETIKYFGELRVLPLDGAETYFNDQLELAQQDIDKAEQALIDFQLEHDIVSVADEIKIKKNVIETLSVSQAKFQFNQTIGANDPASNSILEGLAQANISPAELNPEVINELLQEYRQSLMDITLLEPQYNELVENITAARNRHETLSAKSVETELKQSFALEAFFIQITQKAELPKSASSSLAKTLALGGVGSLGFSILLVFFLDYIMSSRRSTPVSAVTEEAEEA